MSVAKKIRYNVIWEGTSIPSLYSLSRVILDVAIKLIPTIPITVAMLVVFSPRISPSNMKNAAVNAIIRPIIHCAKNAFLFLKIIGSGFSFCFLQTRNAIKAMTTSRMAITIITTGKPSIISILH